MANLINEIICYEKKAVLQKEIRMEADRLKDPLRDCVSKFFGIWNTDSGQIDATRFFEKK